MEILITDIHPNGGLGVFRPEEDLKALDITMILVFVIDYYIGSVYKL